MRNSNHEILNSKSQDPYGQVLILQFYKFGSTEPLGIEPRDEMLAEVQTV